MKTRLSYTFVVGTAIAMGNLRVTAQAQNQPTIAAVADTKAPAPAQRKGPIPKPADDGINRQE